MVWPEIEKAKNEKRRELTFSGAEVRSRIAQDGLDSEIFKLTELNYLNINSTSLETVPEAIKNLKNLQTLVLHSNQLKEIVLPDSGKLKILDLSRNELEEIKNDYKKLQFVSVNLSSNRLTYFANASEHLAFLDLSYNKLRAFPECISRNLAELNLSHNEIDAIPSAVKDLAALKTLNMSNNKLKTIEGDLTRCSKLKDVNFKDNPIADKKLLKLINQERSKQILDYIKQNCPVSVDANKNATSPNAQEEEKDENGCLYDITVQHSTDDGLKIVIKDEVKNVRPYIIACLIKNVTFTDEKFKKFIQMQCKLHDGICDKRQSATIATHDAAKLAAGDLTYTAMAPKELKLQPLNSNKNMTGADLYAKLKAEANALRKEKKRNTYSGIHKYLHLLEGQPKFPCIVDASDRVISFPPITNSEVSKITVATKDILVEVTSSTGIGVARKVADVLLKETVLLFESNLTVKQARVLDTEGNLKSVYPSKTDLIYEDNVSIKIIRQ